MINFHHATLAKKGKRFFEHLNLTFDNGKHYLIRGLNGAGKTLLLEAIAGQIPVLDGYLKYSFIDDRLSWDERFHLRRKLVHYIPAHALQSVMATHPEFYYQQRYYTIGDIELPTVHDFLGGSMSFDRTAFPAAFDIERLLPLEFTRLSNGQLKKVLIVRELMKSVPKVLLMDYPLDGLDANSRREFCNFVDELANACSIQIIMTDQGYELPRVLQDQITLERFRVVDQGPLSTTSDNTTSLSNASKASVTRDSTIIEMKDVEIKYGQHVVIKNLNWRVRKGERWALTGPNGCGKTTLFSLIYADHPMAYSQHVSLFGKRRGSGESIWDIKKRISYLGPEHLHYLNIDLIHNTGRQYLEDEDADRAAVQKLIEHFNAHHFIDQKLRDHSSGQLQLLLLIKTFVASKELLLLDEPFQFLDAVAKAHVNSFLEKKLNSDTTMIMITHDARDVEHWTQKRFDIGELTTL